MLTHPGLRGMTSQNKRTGRNHEQSRTWPSAHTELHMYAPAPTGALAVWSNAIFSSQKAFNSQRLLKVVVLKTKCGCSLWTNAVHQDLVQMPRLAIHWRVWRRMLGGCLNLPGVASPSAPLNFRDFFTRWKHEQPPCVMPHASVLKFL